MNKRNAIRKNREKIEELERKIDLLRGIFDELKEEKKEIFEGVEKFNKKESEEE